MLTRVDEALAAFPARVRRLGAAARRRLDDSGIVGSSLDYPFGLHMARWLASRYPRDVEAAMIGCGGTIGFVEPFARLPAPTFAQKVEGTRMFFRELNRLAVTGVVDPGGFNMAPRDYLPLFTLWQDRELTLRVVYSLFAQRRGAELDDFRDLTQLLPMGVGDDLLRFNGIGEAVTWAMYNNDDSTEVDRAGFYEVARWAAERRMTLTIHWNNDRSVGQLLDLFERLDREVPLHPLRWSIAHLNTAGPFVQLEDRRPGR